VAVFLANSELKTKCIKPVSFYWLFVFLVQNINFLSKCVFLTPGLSAANVVKARSFRNKNEKKADQCSYVVRSRVSHKRYNSTDNGWEK